MIVSKFFFKVQRCRHQGGAAIPYLAMIKVLPMCPSVLLFSKLNKMFFGCFHLHLFGIMIVNDFRGDLPDISAKKESLVSVTLEVSEVVLTTIQ